MKNYIKNLTPKEKKIWLAGLLGLFVVLVILQSASRPKVMTDAQLLTRVANLTEIPDPKIDPPGIFRIENPANMSAFFKNAESGDIAILFIKSQVALIYSVNKDKIINQGPIINDAQTTPKKETVATTTKAATTTR